MLKLWVWALVSLLVLVTGISAQEAGQIGGSARDQTGAVVPGAKVTATEAGTGLARTTTSGSDGSYLLPNLRPTTYTILAEAAGFRSSRETDVILQANQSLTINIAMEV